MIPMTRLQRVSQVAARALFSTVSALAVPYGSVTLYVRWLFSKTTHSCVAKEKI